MIVTAWKNGKHEASNVTYGLTISLADIDKYFSSDWENVLLNLEGQSKPVVVNIKKRSFWNHNCPHLIKKDMGIWLIGRYGSPPWPKNNPPKMIMEHITENKFRVKFSKEFLC